MRNKKRVKWILLSLLVVLAGGVILVPWALEPEHLRGIKDEIVELFHGTPFKDSYNGESLVLTDLSNDENFIYKRPDEPRLPASLAKLYVVEYASTMTDLDDVVQVDPDALAMTKEGSSIAWIEAKPYFIRNLFAAMLVPSGNDAAYALADYCGGILSPEALTAEERVGAFMTGLNQYLQENGYHDTMLYDPSGFDTQARTTVLDLKEVVKKLLEHGWFREIVSQTAYTAALPDGTSQTWHNTNTFLDPTSAYYNENVVGVKTGSLSDDYNLIVLYQMHGKEFLICSLGSKSNDSRYDDLQHILKTIDESDGMK